MDKIAQAAALCSEITVILAALASPFMPQYLMEYDKLDYCTLCAVCDIPRDIMDKFHEPNK